MGDVAIKVENLGKKYRIGGPTERYQTFRDTLANFVKSPLRCLSASPSQEEIWALKDVSFKIKQGEAVGIIGRNGAGKSTLLKILSRITEPTEGRVTLHGRVSSLLEVGTGFHPELTGRENIFLNGAILGMTRAEMKSRFDEIVDFAEIEKFLETPVKRYSSGMYVRLAFAVAAHLEPEILLVDEVLAVGDVQFQKKCLGRMGKVAEEGRTVLFVSHNLGAVKKLCGKSYLLDSGTVLMSGSTNEVVDVYLRKDLPDEPEQVAVFNGNSQKQFFITKASIIDGSGKPARDFRLGSQISAEIEYVTRETTHDGFIIVRVSRNGTDIFQTHDTDLHPEYLVARRPGTYRTRVRFPKRLLPAGEYVVSVKAAIGPFAQFGDDQHPDVLSFTIREDDEETSYKGYAALRGTLVITELDWQTVKLSNQEEQNGLHSVDRTNP